MTRIAIETYQKPAAWHTYRIPIGEAFPVTAEFRKALLPLVLDLLAAVRAQRPAQLIGILQYNQLNIGGAGMIASKMGKQWGLDWGLGYMPEQPPPTLWTVDDFNNLDVGEMPRAMMNQIFGISAGDDQVMSAVDVLFGTGSLLLALTEEPAAVVKARATGQFRPLIDEESLKNFAYYFPMLSAASFSGTSAKQIADWTCGLKFCIRESPEDHGVFLASSEPLEGLFKKLKGREFKAGVFEWLITSAGYAEIPPDKQR
jgi:hypothetical protein